MNLAVGRKRSPDGPMEINVGELRPGQLTQFRFWATDWRNVRRCRFPEAMSSRPSKGSYQLQSANEANDKGSGERGPLWCGRQFRRPAEAQ